VRPPDIELRSEWDTALESLLAERLYEFSSQATGLFDGKPFVGSIKDDSARLIAAVTGHTWGGTCQVTYLWVDKSQRAMGWGRSLLHAVEAEARRRRCTQVILSTHTFQAMRPRMFPRSR
jgi:ribosomal protein S18 acetylase RimI-like enzyme